ncbi:MAG: amidophosphoribosyltransferase [Eubacteriales bacterium]|nr:amidophosphoribosyltransferase [Eubacteriales bacterium]
MIHDECGIFAAFDPTSTRQDAARLTFLGLFAMQHRGEDSAGIAINQQGTLLCQRRKGLVTEGFDAVAINVLQGHAAIGHVRYPTPVDSSLESAQPMLIKSRRGQLALAFNGALTNSAQLRQELQAQGAIFQSRSDSEIMLALLARHQVLEDRPETALSKMQSEMFGAYAMVLMTSDRVIGMRDPNGIRPLCIGELQGTLFLASESCAIDAVGGQFVRDVQPGEIVSLTASGIVVAQPANNTRCKTCLFEYVYFARPDSVIDGTNVFASRVASGSVLAHEHPCDADLVIGAPDSGLAASIGYAQAMKIPHGSGLLKNRYVGRTFLHPNQSHREMLVSLKFTALAEAVKGKKIVLVDDSLVRGTTTRHVINLLRKAGAQEVHMRVASPPLQYPCHYGVETPGQHDLSACELTQRELVNHIGADSLGFLSLNGLQNACGSNLNQCTACFSGQYPVALAPELAASIRQIDPDWFFNRVEG